MTSRLRFRLVLCVALAAICAAAVHAQVVVYLEGDCEVHLDDEWLPLSFGDMLYPDETVRLHPEAYLEIRTERYVLVLSRPGTYRLDDLIGAAGRAWFSGASRFFEDRLGAVLGSSTVLPQTVASGVRGEATDPATPDTDGRDARIIRKASAQLESGNLEDAFYTLEAGLAGIEDPRFGRDYAYLLGLASYGLDDSTSAADFLGKEGPDPDTGYYYDHAMLFAQVQIEVYAYEDAIDVLEDLTAWYAGAQRDSNLLLLLGIAYLENGQADLAADSLSKVTDEPALVVAERLLAEMGE